MRWLRCTLFLAGLFTTRYLSADAEVERVGINEMLSYECARDVASLVPGEAHLGPLFREGDLIFWSLTDATDKPVLLVDAGSGLYSIELGRAGVNRLRFELPAASVERRHTFFLNYLHDSAIRSRYLEFAVDAPPTGHFDIDYLLAIPRRAGNLLPHLDYAIFETSENMINAIVGGRLPRASVVGPSVRSCDHLARENPALARRVSRNLAEVTPSGRR